MMFLIRVAFWLSIVLLLLPSGPTKPGEAGPQVGALDALSVAGTAVADMRQFCARQPDACAVGSQVAAAVAHKAQAGAKMIYDFLTERGAGDGATPAGPKSTASGPEPADRGGQNTLSPADLAPAWRGPQPRHEMVAKRTS